jgi:putative transposase
MVLPLTQLTERERAQAMERFDVLRPVLEGQEQLAAIADHYQMSLRTLQRWIRRYHTEG